MFTIDGSLKWFLRILKLIGWPLLAFSLMCMIWDMRIAAGKYAKNPRAHPEAGRFAKVYAVARVALWVLRVEIQTVGMDQVPKSPAFYAPNHKSSVDSIVMFVSIFKKKDIPLATFVAKKELMDSKTAKAAITLIDGVFLDRANPRQAVAVIEELKKTLTGYHHEDRTFSPKSIIVFPEGHRHPNNEFGEFRGGTFKPAYQAFKSIVPVAICNTRGIIDRIEDKKQLKFFRSVKIVFGKKIDPQSFFNVASDVLAGRVKDNVIRLFNENNGK